MSEQIRDIKTARRVIAELRQRLTDLENAFHSSPRVALEALDEDEDVFAFELPTFEELQEYEPFPDPDDFLVKISCG
jgi:hypothetical protein